jgi:hypothetical protein
LKVDGGRTNISTLAAATAQREATVQAGLAWLEAQGHLAVHQDGDKVHLTAGYQKENVDLPQIAARLREHLDETATYRAHFGRAEKETLIQSP